MKHSPPPILASVTVLLLALLTGGCATVDNQIKQAEAAVAAGRYEEGIAALDDLGRNDSRADTVRAAQLRNRTIASEQLTLAARRASEAERFDDAERLYQRLRMLNPAHAQIDGELRHLHALREQSNRLAKADESLRRSDDKEAERLIRGVLLENPNHRKALALLRQIEQSQRKTAAATVPLGPDFMRKISLELRDINLKSAFDAIWHESGINFILDRDVRNDAKATIYVHDVTVAEAIDALLMTQQLAKKAVNAKTLFIYPKTPQKTLEYQDLVVRNFYLGYADAKQMQAMLKTILKIKEVHIDEKRNLVVIRDNSEAVEMAEKLVRAHDQAEPEVMLALDVIEIRRSKLSEIGLDFPSQVSAGLKMPITLQALRSLNGASINVDISGAGGSGVVGQLNLKKADGDTNMLANPRIRVRNREKAKIHIGDRLPVVTTTSSTTSSFVGQTVNYLDVGLKLEVEPQVMLDGDVVIKLNLEVSSATPSKVNSGFYDVGTRNTATVLTIRDGETQVLAGLIRDDERKSADKLPALGDVPLLGRLFSSERHEQDKTEIILAITPHVLQNLARPSFDLAEYVTGPESGHAGGAGQSFSAVLVNAPTASPSPVAPPLGTNSVGRPTLPQVPATAAPSQSGVIPIVDFEPPPGVGSSRGSR